MKNLIYILFITILVSCSSTNKENNIEATEIYSESSEFIELTKEQIKLAEITTILPAKKHISELIHCTGNIEALPENMASVSPILGGYIKELNYFPGNKVEKGAILATLQHPDFIDLQKQYLEAKSQMEYYQEEFKRQGELTVENAASIKNMQRAKADYLSSEAQFKSLKSKLNLLGVNTDNIEKGDFNTEYQLIAPISGVISKLSANAGKYVSPDQYIFEIINDSKLNLNLNVFEKDIHKIKVGQKIKFKILNDDLSYQSKVSRIGIKVDENNRTVMVQGIYQNTNHELKPGMHIVASILQNEKEVFVLPEEAIVESDGKFIVFVKNEDSFKAITINKGVDFEGYTEVLNIDKSLINKKIVTKGSYYLMSILEAEE